MLTYPRLIQSISFVLVLFSVSCNKDSVKSPAIPSNNKFTPTCAYYSSENISGSWRDFVYFFDLSEASNSQKLYFVAKPIFADKDTLAVVVEPRSVDSLGPNFPSEIKDHPGFGWVKQWTNPVYRLKFNGSFYKEPVAANSIFNDASKLGSLAGRWPQAQINSYLQEPLGNGTLLRHYAYFYFGDNRCYHTSVLVSNAGNATYEPYGLRPISSISPGFSKYDWTSVSAYFALYKSFNDRQTHYFLDFKNWRYFTVVEGAANVGPSGTQPTISFNDYKSLDNLVKWPSGWGKG
jgi:hypothetical protein